MTTQAQTLVSSDGAFREKVRSILERTEVCMLCTHGEGARIESRPMTLQAIDFHGNLWFFCSGDLSVARNLEADGAVTIAILNPKEQQCAVLKGKGKLEIDRARMEQLWKPEYVRWFPAGLEDPHISLLRVELDEAEYWEWPSGPVAAVMNRIETMMTGEESPLAVHEKKRL